MEQFNKVSHLYSSFVEQDPFRQYLHYPAVISELRKHSFGSVVDVGCGDGFFPDLLISKRLASRVLGYDSAPGQITKAADKLEFRSQQKLSFQCADHKTVRINPLLDNATSIMVLPYAKNASELGEIFQAIYTHLRAGAKFISVIFNPCFNKFNIPMGTRCFNRTGAGQVSVEFLNRKTSRACFVSSLTQYSRYDYLTAAYSAGFANLKWEDILPTPQGLRSFGNSFWLDCIQSQPYQLLIAEK